MKQSDLKNEAAVASDLGIEVISSSGMPVFRWPDGFQAEISLMADEEFINAVFIPDRDSDPELGNKRMAEFLRAVQRQAEGRGLGILVEDQLRSEVGHILDHLGFSICRETLEDNQFWGEIFDDADFEWYPDDL